MWAYKHLYDELLHIQEHQKHQQGAGLEEEQPEFEQALVEDGGITGGGLTCYPIHNLEARSLGKLC